MQPVIDPLIGPLLDLLIDSLIDLLIGPLIDPLIDTLIDPSWNVTRINRSRHTSHQQAEDQMELCGQTS